MSSSRAIIGDHEAIIDRETWDRVQAKLTVSTAQADNNHSNKDGSAGGSAANNCADRTDKPQSDRSGSSGCNHRHPLYGKVICSGCGSLMTRRTFHASSKKENCKDTYKVWTCKERYKGRQGNGCKMRHVREDDVLEAIRRASSLETGQEINTQEGLKASFADIDYIKVGQNEVTVIWKKKTGK